MSYLNNLPVRCLLAITFAASLWAGREFPAKPGEAVIANELIVKLKPQANIAAVLAAVAPTALADFHAVSNIHRLTVPAASVAAISALLAARPDVDYVEPNRIRSVNVNPPNDTSYSQQWDLTLIQAIQAWTLLPNQYFSSGNTNTGRIKVAVLDTGADCTHPDFKNGGASTDTAQGGQFNFALSQAPIATTIATPACPWEDDHGHGTHTAGTIGASTQNAAGVASLGYSLQIIVFKVLDKTGSGSDVTISDAIKAAADAGASVISLSLGGGGYSQTLQNAVNYAWQRNSLVVAAKGNSNSGSIFYPADANYAIGVGATDSNDAIASFSNWGLGVDLVAPGVGILSTYPTYFNSGYATFDGTSMATPHVAALAGLLASSTANLPAASIALRMEQSADSTISGGGWDQHLGFGRMNAWRALSGNLRSSSLGGIVGQVVDSNSLPLSAQLTVNGLSYSTDPSNGLYRFSSLAPGTYSLVCTSSGFTSRTLTATVVAGGDTTLTIVMGTNPGAFTGTVTRGGIGVGGVVVQALSGALISGTAVTAPNGSYTLYVPAGSYTVRAADISNAGASVASQSVVAGGSTTVNISITRFGTISGTVKDSSLNPVQYAQVSVTGGGLSFGAATDAAGSYSTIGIPAGLYTVTASAPGYQTVLANGISVANGAATPVNLQFNGTVSFTPIRVDAGSTTPYTDTLGQVWAADNGFAAGCGGLNNYPNAPIGGTTTAPGVYRTFHNGDCIYTTAVPNGSYTVNLMFAEVALSGPGRSFNVFLNGQQVLSNFDIFQTAGGANLPVVKSFPVTVTTGQIAVQLAIVNIGSIISGIEILASAGPVAVAVSPQGPVALAASGTQQFTATVTGTGTTTVTWGYSPQVGTLVVNGNTATYTAPNPISAAQNVTVTATSTVDATKSASGTVSLTPAVAVAVSPQGPVALGASGTQQFTATVTGTGTTTVTWGYSPQVGTLVVNGNTATYTAPNPVSVAQNVTVTATSTVDATKSASGTVSLTPAVAVAVSPQGPVALGASGTQQFTATVTGTGTTTVTWGYSPQVGTLVVNGNTATYTAPNPISAAQNVTVTATSTVDSTKSASGTVSLTPGGGFTPIRVNAGATAPYTDTLGQVWAADSGFTPGCGGVNSYPNAPIGGTTTAPGVYRSFHYGDCTFTAVVPNGTYTVNLMFAEVALNGPGRSFNVFLNGQQVLSNFDIYQTAGGANLPVVKPFPLTVTGGQIAVRLSIVNIGAIISGIEILSSTGGAVAVAVSPQGPVALGASGTQQFTATVTGTATTTVTWGYSPQVGTLVVNGNTATYTAPNPISVAQNVTVTATSTVDATKSASGTVSLTPAGGFTPIRVNAGSTVPYTDTLGQVWAADSGFTPGCGGVNSYPNAPIGGTTTAPGVYRSFHYGDCTFTTAVPNGSYTVNLMFAEVALNGPGRSFNVYLNGQQVLSNFDIWQTAGGANLPVVKPFPVTVTNGQIAVQLSIVNYGAIISGIEILSSTGGPVAVTVGPLGPVALSASGTQQFAATVTGTSTTTVTWGYSPQVGTLVVNGNTATYTAPNPVSVAQNVTVTATSTVDVTKSASGTVSLSPAGGFTPIRVNAGSTAPYTDTLGRVWAADSGFTPGCGGLNSYPNAPIGGTTTAPAVYRSFHYGDCTFTAVVPNGSYTVNLMFAEVALNGPGRSFNVFLNGQLALQNFDIWQTAGGANLPVVKPFPVTVTNGQIAVQLSIVNVGAIISGIEILSSTGGTVAVAVSPQGPVALSAAGTQQFTATVTGTSTTTVTWGYSPQVGTLVVNGNTATYTAPNPVSAAQNVTVTATSTVDATKSASGTVSLTPAGGFTPIRVNAGSTAPYTDTLGQVWAADSGFTPGCGGVNSYPNAPIGGTTTAPGVYRSFHYGDCTFTAVVPNGTYTVNLMFAEVALNGPGRSFNVFLNGQQVLSNFDIYQTAGGANLPVVKPFPVTVTTGQIAVRLSIVNYGAIISGIEILSSTGGPVAVAVSPQGPVALGASGTQQFTATVTGTATTTVTWGYSPQVGTLVVNGNTATYTAPSSISVAQNVTVTATSTVDATKSASGTVSLTTGGGFTPIRVDAGSTVPYTDTVGKVWAADSGFTPGCGGVNSYPNAPIGGTTTAPGVYRTFHYGDCTFTAAVPNGSYTVNLMFAEVALNGPGRSFNVSLNGQQVLSNFDIYQTAGGANLPVVKSFPITVVNGQITVQLSIVNYGAIISGIEILSP